MLTYVWCKLVYWSITLIIFSYSLAQLSLTRSDLKFPNLSRKGVTEPFYPCKLCNVIIQQQNSHTIFQPWMQYLTILKIILELYLHTLTITTIYNKIMSEDSFHQIHTVMNQCIMSMIIYKWSTTHKHWHTNIH